MAEKVMTVPEINTPRTFTGDIVLRTNNLTKQYGKRIAVKNLNLEVRRGEIMGFLGPNGAGKTTTIRMALGLIAPTTGSVEILGQEVATHGSRILPRVGALVETPALYLYMSGRNNLRAVASVLGGIPASRIDAVLDLVGLRARQKDRVRTYSLDEPANGLDPAGIVEMRDLMHRLTAEDKTVFISSHLLTEVQQICTRVSIINLGELVKVSTIEDLISGHGEFVVTLERVQEALALVKAQRWGKDARLDARGALVTTAPGNRGRDLNLFLVDAGFAPETIAQSTQDLEQVFLELTNSGTGEIQ